MENGIHCTLKLRNCPGPGGYCARCGWNKDEKTRREEDIAADRNMITDANGIKHLVIYRDPESELLPEKAAPIGISAPVAVRCVDTGVVYPSLKAASRATGADSSSISMVCQGKRRHAKGLRWEYVGDEVTV